MGEVAGTYGVTRSGGAALNAGQVGGLRVATHCAARGCAVPAAIDGALGELTAAVEESAAHITSGLAAPEEVPTVAVVRDELQARMSDYAGFICQVDELPGALAGPLPSASRYWQGASAHSAQVRRWISSAGVISRSLPRPYW